jgi:hypothetical protein
MGHGGGGVDVGLDGGGEVGAGCGGEGGLGSSGCGDASGGDVGGKAGEVGIAVGGAVGRAPILNVRVISEPMRTSSELSSCQTNSNVCGLLGAVRPIVTSVVSSRFRLPINQLSGQPSGLSDTSTRLVSSGHGQVPLLRSKKEKEGREFTYQKRYGSLISISSAS